MNWGHAVERRVADLIRNDDALDAELKYVAGPNKADFVSKRYPLIRFDVTTEGQLHGHRIRPEYGRGLTMLVQDGPGELTAFP